MANSYQRYYRSEVQIDLEQIKRNAKVLMRNCPEGTLQLAVVKANAYGHGSVAVAQALSGTVDWFAVATVHEGIELREAGISRPILVLGPPHEQTASYYRQFDLTATVSASHHLSRLPKGVSYHLNIDTGMNRLGVPYDDIEEVLTQTRTSDSQLTGLMTHFATADEPDHPMVTKQRQRFDSVREYFPEVLVHTANTGALSYYRDLCYDMVRTGIGLYGYAPGNRPIEGIRPVLRWVSRVDYVHRVKAGESVSYGATWQAEADCYIATIPVGYADGIPRLISNKLNVRVGDRLVPSVGTVTMDYIMVNLGETSAPEGTEVELMGPNAMSAAEWAAQCATIPYEILTGINDRVKRSYR
jgi:alanine racemase